MQRWAQVMMGMAIAVVLTGSALAEVGTGTLNQVSGWYPADSQLSVTATPDANSTFDTWSGDTADATIDGAQITFTVDAPKSITARFAHIMHIITASAGENGSITPAGEISVKQGESQAFTIAAAENYVIDDVLVDSVSVGALSSYTFENVTAAHTIAASFKLDSYTVTFDLGTYGTFVDTGAALVQTVEHGSAATAPDFTVADSHTFTGWSATFDSVTADLTVTAQYEIKTYTLIYLAGDNGSITGDLAQTVNHGASGTAVTAVPAEGFQFLKWSDERTDNPRTDESVTANVSVTASFARNLYSFTVNSAHGNPIPGTMNYEHGEWVSFSMPVSEIVDNVTTQYVANGWVGTGSLESSATGTNGTFQIVEDSSITWQWSTNYWIEINVATE
ncbi:MAG: InlB B-repeat-containing protein [Kiritimatiellia bacterium]